MKAPARLDGAAAPARPAVSDHRWRRWLLRVLGIAVAVLALLAAMVFLDHAEGDLRQVMAPASDAVVDAVSTRMA
ncbi:hypothetical protein [Roseateles sp. MS654]|uniref:hypothetical protein n=1 Tax=Roseateles sp. MS654 TaxID=3412685 RepID=UPI003C2D776C